MTILINLLGASSVGKSTLMSDLFSEMKLRDMNVEMSMEWIKGWAWEGYCPNAYDQFYIIGNEIKQQSRLFHKVDYIISDSPVIIASFYKAYLTGEDNLTGTVKEFYKMAENDGIIIKNFLLTRNKPYEIQGRYQTEEEANNVANGLYNYLYKHNIDYTKIETKDRDRVKDVFKELGLTF